MKSFYLLLSLFVSTGLFAQDFSYSPSQVLDTDLVTDDYNFAQIDFNTVDSTGVTFIWQAIENTIPAEWEYSLCDYTSCYSGIPATGTMTAITTPQMESGVMGFLKITVQPGTTSGNAVVRFKVSDQADPSKSDTITFNFTHTSTASVKELTVETLSMYPNPANDVINLSNGGTTNINYVITDLTGKSVNAGVVGGNETEQIDVSVLPAGLYFLRTVNTEGIEKIQKLIVK